MSTNVLPVIPGLNLEDLKLNGFRVHKLNASMGKSVARGRRDFYKMSLITTNMTVYYDDKVLDIKDTVLFFINPNIPHSVVFHSKKRTGYACLFTEAFIAGWERSAILKSSPLFHTGDMPLIRLNTEQAAFLTGIFQKMLTVYSGDYHHKGELIRSCIELIIQEALRIQPSQKVSQFKNAAARNTHLFMDLLERQFPIERTGESLRLRNAQDFAAALSLHINYLNRSVKEVTGKPTSAHISARIISEAKALLQYTDWSVADIAYALGFEYPTYFNNYFKRETGTNPNSFRNKKV